MLVSEILATVRPAYCDSWEEVFALFREDPHERRRVEELMEELRSGRALEEPGRIDRREPYEDEEPFEPYYYLGNGTHRFAAHHFLGLEDFPVTHEEEPREEQDFYEMTEVRLWILDSERDPAADAATDFEDAVMDCCASSLSFRVAPGVWAECGGQSSTRIRDGREYELSFLPVPSEHLRAFTEKLLDRISCCVTPAMIADVSVYQAIHYEPSFWGGENHDQ